MNFPHFTPFPQIPDDRFEGGRPHQGVVHEKDFFAFQDFGQRGVFHAHRIGPVFSVDECPAYVAIAKETLHRGKPQVKSERIGHGIGRFGHRDHDVVVPFVQRLDFGQFAANGIPHLVNRAPFQHRYQIGEVDPLEEAVGGFSFRPVALHAVSVTVGDNHFPRLQVPVVHAHVGQNDALGRDHQ